MLLIQAFRKKFIIPEFDVFAQKINGIYDAVQNNSGGKVAICCLFVLMQNNSSAAELLVVTLLDVKLIVAVVLSCTLASGCRLHPPAGQV